MQNREAQNEVLIVGRRRGPWPGLARWGLFGFAAFSAVSIAAAQISWGVACLGVILGLITRQIRYRPTPLDIPILLFILAEGLSIVFSVHPGRSFRCWDGDWILLFFPVFTQAVRSRRDAERAIQILLISSSIVAAYAIWQMFAGRDLMRGRGLEPIGDWFIATGTFGHHLTYGGSVLITASLAFTLLLSTVRQRAMGWKISAIVLQVGGLLASFARTAWIGFFACVGALILLARGLPRRLAGLAIGASILAAIALPAIRARLGDLLTFPDDPRVRLWHTALRIWWDHPIFGAGLGSYKTQFPIYKVPGEYMAHGHPHNDVLNILVHSGILGIATFAYIFLRYFHLITRTRALLDVADARRPYLLAALLVPIAFFVGGMGQCFLTDEEVGQLFWFIIAIFVAFSKLVCDEIA